MRRTTHFPTLLPFSFLLGLALLALAGLPFMRPVSLHAAPAVATLSITLVSSPGPTLTPAPPCSTPAWHETTISDTLVGISAIAPDDVWAAGGYAGYHWDGNTWAVHPFPTPYWTVYPRPTVTYGIVGIAATSSAGVLVAANGPLLPRAATLRWTGSTWLCTGSSCPPPVVKQPESGDFWSQAVAAIGAYDIFYSVAGSGSGWSSGTLYDCTSQGCIDTELPLSTIGVSGTSPGDVWAFGYHGFIGEYQWVMLHRAGTTWTEVGHPEIGSLRAIAGIGPDDAWAVGTKLWHWDGITWTDVSAPILPVALAGRAGDDVWAIGSTIDTDSVIGHWDGTSWRVVYTPGVRLTRLSVSPAGDVWAIGGSTVLHYASERFRDVPLGSTFHDPIERLACRGIVSGYPCGGGEPCDAEQRPYFRPAAGVSRGQMVKIVALAAGWTLLNPPTATFADVSPGSTFYSYIETGAAQGVVSGYPCGTQPGEPCDGDQRPYFRPADPVSRGQLAKIIVRAHAYPPPPGSDVTFADVPANSTFYLDIETVAATGIVSGYPCGTRPDEPCDAQARPYFRPAAGASRGQVSKIVDLALSSTR